MFYNLVLMLKLEFSLNYLHHPPFNWDTTFVIKLSLICRKFFNYWKKEKSPLMYFLYKKKNVLLKQNTLCARSGNKNIHYKYKHVLPILYNKIEENHNPNKS